MSTTKKQIEPRFISRLDFSRAIGVSEPTAERMIAEGRVAATRTGSGRGSRWLVPVSEVDRLLREAESARLAASDGPTAAKPSAARAGTVQRTSRSASTDEARGSSLQ